MAWFWAQVVVRAEPMAEFEEGFRKSAWRGGDAVYSVPLSGEKTLWLFGDSWVEGRRRMVRNSLAIQAKGGAPEFFWRGQDDAFACPEPGAWLWPFSGLRRNDT